MIFNVERASSQPVEQDKEINTLEELLAFIEAQDDCLAVVITRCNKDTVDGRHWTGGGTRDWNILIYDDWIE